MKRYGLEPQVHLVEGSPALQGAAARGGAAGAVPRRSVDACRWTGRCCSSPTSSSTRCRCASWSGPPQGWRERDGRRSTATGASCRVAGDRPMDAAVPDGAARGRAGHDARDLPGRGGDGVRGRRAAGRSRAARRCSSTTATPSRATGSTLQAVRAHRKVDPFAAPGEADLTAHVDFAALADIARSRGARWLGTVPQGAWLRALGIEARAEALADFAPQHREALMRARDRLIGDGQMGLLFKVMGLAGPTGPTGWGSKSRICLTVRPRAGTLRGTTRGTSDVQNSARVALPCGRDLGPGRRRPRSRRARSRLRRKPSSSRPSRPTAPAARSSSPVTARCVYEGAAACADIGERTADRCRHRVPPRLDHQAVHRGAGAQAGRPGQAVARRSAEQVRARLSRARRRTRRCASCSTIPRASSPTPRSRAGWSRPTPAALSPPPR